VTNAAIALPDWVGALISLGAAVALLGLRAWIVSPWRANQGSKAPERRRSQSRPTTVPRTEAVRERVTAARASAGAMSRSQTRAQLRSAERTQSAPSTGGEQAAAHGPLRSQHS
jgi:hypothetical protein